MDLVSPNDMFEAAKEMQLGGREPVTEQDWVSVMNFFAANVMKDAAMQMCQLMRVLFEMPLSEEYVTEIVRFQVQRKAELN
jgi:hypothetical protein